MDPQLVMASKRKVEEMRLKKGGGSGGVASSAGAGNEVEGAEIFALKASLEGMRMERDAAIVCREDLSAQVRMWKRRVQDAEEEQYRAEADAAALRKEVELLQQGEHALVAQSPRFSMQADELKRAQQEMDALRLEMQGLLHQLRQEQQRCSAAQDRFDSVTAEKCDLQNALGAAAVEKAELQKAVAAALAAPSGLGRDLLDFSSATSGVAAESSVDGGASYVTERSRHEEQVHHLQQALQKQEKSTHMLLTEIDVQSLEIERLFAENSSLSASLRETSDLAAKWEEQLKESLKHNAAECRQRVKELGLAQASVSISSPATTSVGEENEKPSGGGEAAHLRSELSRAMARSEELQAHVDQMSVDLSHALQVVSNVGRAYQPVLLNIESRLAGLHLDFKRSVY